MSEEPSYAPTSGESAAGAVDAGRPPVTSGGPQVWPSQTLLAGQQEARIAHNGELYTLRRTRAGRLILTK